MKIFKKPLLIAIAAGSLLMGTGCAEDQMSKGLLALAGAGAGALVGSKLNPDDPMMGGILGGGIGLVLGGLVGMVAGKK